jgi:hypothetical protein
MAADGYEIQIDELALIHGKLLNASDQVSDIASKFQAALQEHSGVFGDDKNARAVGAQFDQTSAEALGLSIMLGQHIEGIAYAIRDNAARYQSAEQDLAGGFSQGQDGGYPQ